MRQRKQIKTTRWMRQLSQVLLCASALVMTVSVQASAFGVSDSNQAQANQSQNRPPLMARSSLQVAAAKQEKQHLAAESKQKQATQQAHRVTRQKNPNAGLTQHQQSIRSGADEIMKGATLRDQAFSNAARMLMPMTPSQIETLHYLYAQSERAVSSSVSAPPRPTTTELALNISPGSTPPVIRLSAGFVTSVALIDSTSSPWPIEWIDVGNPKDYNVQWDKKSNIVIIQALTSYGSANMAMKLVGLTTPIMLTLMPGQKVVDYRVDLRVPGIGPNGTTASVQGLPSMGNPVILSVLNGVPPKSSIVLHVTGGSAQAWLINNQVYLRTRMTVLSPSWITQLSSGDGMHVYVLPVSPVVLAMSHGQMVSLTVKHDG